MTLNKSMNDVETQARVATLNKQGKKKNKARKYLIQQQQKNKKTRALGGTNKQKTGTDTNHAGNYTAHNTGNYVNPGLFICHKALGIMTEIL